MFRGGLGEVYVTVRVLYLVISRWNQEKSRNERSWKTWVELESFFRGFSSRDCELCFAESLSNDVSIEKNCRAANEKTRRAQTKTGDNESRYVGWLLVDTAARLTLVDPSFIKHQIHGESDRRTARIRCVSDVRSSMCATCMFQQVERGSGFFHFFFPIRYLHRRDLPKHPRGMREFTISNFEPVEMSFQYPNARQEKWIIIYAHIL